MNLLTVQIEKPDAVNFVLGQTHFIKSVEDIHEALVNSVPGIKFGLAFCEASGKCLIRWTGTDPAMIALAQQNRLQTLIASLGSTDTLDLFPQDSSPDRTSTYGSERPPPSLSLTVRQLAELASIEGSCFPTHPRRWWFLS
jgi:hypothetical protein